MATYEKQLRSLLEDFVRSKAHDFNDCLHYWAALTLIATKFRHAEIGIVMEVLDDLLKEGVVWL